MVVNVFAAIRDTVVPIMATLFDAAVGAFKGIYDFTVPLVQAWYGAVSNGIASFVQVFKSGFGVIVDTLRGPVTSALSLVGDGMVTLRDVAVKALLTMEYGYKNWQDVATLAGLTVIESAVTVAGQVQHLFGEVIPEVVKWLGQVFFDAFNYWTAVFKNFAGNVVAIFRNLPALIKGAMDWSDVWTPLTEGFEKTVRGLPQIAERQKGAFELALEVDIHRLGGKLSTGFAEFAAGRLEEMQQQTSAFNGAVAAIVGAGSGFKMPELPKLPGMILSPVAPVDVGSAATSLARKGIDSQSLSSRFLGLADRFKAGRAGGGPEERTATAAERTAKGMDKLVKLPDEIKSLADAVKRGGGMSGRDVRLA